MVSPPALSFHHLSLDATEAPLPSSVTSSKEGTHLSVEFCNARRICVTLTAGLFEPIEARAGPSDGVHVRA